MTKTEKLRAVIEAYLNSPVNTFKPTHILSRQILEACKEAGLQWAIKTDAYHGYWKFKEIKV